MLGMTPGATAVLIGLAIIALLLLGGQVVSAVRDVRIAKHTGTDPSASRAEADADASKTFWTSRNN